MKKKNYIQPQTEVMTVGPATLLADSVPEYDGSLGARETTIWDEDDFR